MSTAVPPVAAEVPAPPRTVPWRAAARAGVGWGVAGALLLAAGIAVLVRQDTGGVSPLDPDAPPLPGFGLLVLPGIAGLLLAWRAVFRRRWLLINGVATPATLVYQQHVDLPGLYGRLLCYRFVDVSGTEHERRQWAWAGSAEWRAARAGGEGLVAIHDPERPARCRLVYAPALTELVGR